mmetsp:Transcript_20750/g.57650  ORF Transcript_20750/g.57650 Transcript_20750/m.57650 type:complete len:122 (-) Transcript_20750:1022-1387(-)
MQERKKEALTNNIEPLLVTCKFQATARGQPLFVDVASLSADSPEPDLTPEEELELVKKMIGDMKDIENADRLLKEVEVMQMRPQYLPITTRTYSISQVAAKWQKNFWINSIHMIGGLLNSS